MKLSKLLSGIFLLCFAVMPIHANAWISFNGSLPTSAFVAGRDVNGRTLYLCRASYKNSIQPGKTWNGLNGCLIPYGGREITLRKFSVFTANRYRNRLHYRDVNKAYGRVMGRDTNGKSLFACRSWYKNSLQPGKTWMNYSYCNISFAGKEIRLPNYQVLTNRGGRIMPSRPSQNAKQYPSRPHFRKHSNYQCIKDVFGNESCGYHCIKNNFKAGCANSPRERCVSNVFNEIKCGMNCRVDAFNQIQCD